ncbi:hypothetical protein KEM48_009878 [Puccinia striiformis f. sp. tritici PST-130]|nr:hypothetical protein KEM48_009878 [Puccinia striiformis f. sp. tritici PST-130]
MASSTDYNEIDPFKETVEQNSTSTPTSAVLLLAQLISTKLVQAAALQLGKVEHQPIIIQSPTSSINTPKSPIPPIAAVTTPGRGGRPTLRDLKDVEEIRVMDAIKTSEGGSSSYIAYVIQSSVFRIRVASLFPCCPYPVLIVPPIPDKQSLGDYAFNPSSMAKTKEDPVTVARRKRMLAVFLNRLIRHPVLGRERVLWQFLAPDVSWSEILQQPPLSNLSKNPMKAPAHNPSDLELQALFSHLPVPSSSSVPLQDPDQRFLDSEVFTSKFSSILQIH